MKASPDQRTAEERLWAMLKGLFYELDRQRSGCRRPGFLGPKDRLQGFGVFEKRNGNIHAHILICCRSYSDQFFTALCLFGLLDTVEKREEPRDAIWAREAWEFLQGEITDLTRTRTFSPMLARWAPRGTAMVQVVRTDEDRRKVCRYMTKEAGSDFHLRELREFHPTVNTPATRLRRDRQTGALVLDLDHPHPWKRDGKRIA